MLLTFETSNGPAVARPAVSGSLRAGDAARSLGRSIRGWISAMCWLAFAGSAIACPQRPVRICPIGDSIVESFGGQATPRYYLDQLLQLGGYSFDFVGHNAGAFGGPPRFPNFDQNHEAYSGWRVDDMLLSLGAWLQETNPDIALIHLGTNDMLRFQSPESTVAELEQCIDIARGANPSMTIMISQITPMVWRDVRFLNRLLPALVDRKDTTVSRVVLVDHYTPFDLSRHFLPDGLHPNDLGEQVFAQVWYDALLPFVSPMSYATTTIGSGCATAFGLTTLTPIAGQAATLGNPYSMHVRNVPPNAALFGLLGFSRTQFNGLQLPIDLTPIGSTGCSLYVGPAIVDELTIQPGAYALWTRLIPNDVSMVHGAIYVQAGLLGAALNPLGLALTDAHRITILAGY